MNGGKNRAARRAGNVSAFTRAQAVRLIAACASKDDCAKWSEHPNRHVREYAFARALKLETLRTKPSIIQDVSSPSESEFDSLVERFTREGKKDPRRSAFASMAARKQAEKRRAAAA